MKPLRGIRPSESALAKILEIELSFTELLTPEEVFFECDDCSDGSGKINDVCFTFWNRLQDLRQSAAEAAERGEEYPVVFAKEQWLDIIATYCGIISRRFAAGEKLLDSEGVTKKFREQLTAIREQLVVIYGNKLAKLEALEKVDVESF